MRLVQCCWSCSKVVVVAPDVVAAVGVVAVALVGPDRAGVLLAEVVVSEGFGLGHLAQRRYQANQCYLNC